MNKKQSKFNSESYYVVQGWMMNELGLKSNELLIYAIIYGFTKDGENWFVGSIDYLSDAIGSSNQTVYNQLNSLIEKGALIKEVEYYRGISRPRYKVCLKHIRKKFILNDPQNFGNDPQNFGNDPQNFGNDPQNFRDNNIVYNKELNNSNGKIDIGEINSPVDISQKENLDLELEKNNDKQPKKVLQKNQGGGKFNFLSELKKDFSNVDIQILEDYMQVRKDKRASNTKTAYTKLKNQIEAGAKKGGWNETKIFELIVSKSWQGFNADWLDNQFLEKDKPYSANDPIRIAREKDIGKGVNDYSNLGW